MRPFMSSFANAIMLTAGAHTGKFGFDTFTHLRASLDSPSWSVLFYVNLMLGPYSGSGLICFLSSDTPLITSVVLLFLLSFLFANALKLWFRVTN